MRANPFDRTSRARDTTMTTSSSDHRSSGSDGKLVSAQSGWPGHSVLPVSVFLSLKFVYCLPSWYSTNGAVLRAASMRRTSNGHLYRQNHAAGRFMLAYQRT
jgi:hypothetical protein